MIVSVVLEHRFCRTPDGAIWTQAAFAYPFWSRYLHVFDRVRVVARVQDVAAVDPGWLRADGPAVSCIAVTDYLGPREYLQRARAVRRDVAGAFRPGDAMILRVPSPIATTLEATINAHRYPYGVEVVGDPYDVFAPGAVSHPLRPFFRWWFSRRLKQQCGRASAASYVTEKTLQRRYPCPGFFVGVSDVEITDCALVDRPRVYAERAFPITLITVGSLAQLYKAPDVLIDAVAQCIREGLHINLVMIGDGKHRAELEDRVKQAGFSDRIAFLGQIPAGDSVRAQLDRADVFVLPSKTEGLPRAMIEAMARGLPCIGSTAGGIPELLPPEDMVPPGDVAALAAKIREVVTDPTRMSHMSARNLRRAEAFREAQLSERRLAFYRRVREQTEAWCRNNS